MSKTATARSAAKTATPAANPVEVARSLVARIVDDMSDVNGEFVWTFFVNNDEDKRPGMMAIVRAAEASIVRSADDTDEEHESEVERASFFALGLALGELRARLRT